MSGAQKFFGTDGVRGVANRYPITPEVALRLGRLAAKVLVVPMLEREAADGRKVWPRCIIGKDTRISCDLLESAFAAGMASEGVDVLLAGVVPTPAVSLLVREEEASMGVVISASHNPFPDNGIKFFNGGGQKLSNEQEAALEAAIAEAAAAPEQDNKRPTDGKVGRISHMEKASERYNHFVFHEVGGSDHGLLAGMKVVLDCANGAASKTSPEILRVLGAEVTVFADEPNGVNINEDCGCTHMEIFSKLVVASDAKVGIAHDGDADRIGLCDENGDALDGDELLAIVALHYLKAGKLKNNTLVATIMSNCGLDAAMEEAGGKLVRAGVGDRFVIQEMCKDGLNFGGEQSGHIVCGDYLMTADGIIAGVEVLKIMVETGKPLSELRQCLKKFPQLLLAIPVNAKPPVEELVEAQALVKETEDALDNAGQVLLRYSGTEPKIRLLIEGKDADYIQAQADKITAAINAQIGV
ncbi:MAG: phosphoglucosamine mutase [Verrucomicrobiales bacterium]|jgi:phosphoglucosamine mutase